MEKTPFTIIKLKLDRSLSQLNELLDKMRQWGNENSIKLKAEFLDQRLGFEVKVENFENPLIFEEWSILIGEFLHNLRSSLDNLAFSLARIKKSLPENPSQIYFPIFMTEMEFNQRAKTKLLRHFTDEIGTLITILQPFQRAKPEIAGNPQSDCLAILHQFSNSDKHRNPAILLMIPEGTLMHSQSIAFYSEDDAALNVPPQVEIFVDSLKSGLVLMRHKTNKPIKEVSGNMNLSAKMYIELPNGEKAEIEILLRKLHYYTNLIAEQFRRFFV